METMQVRMHKTTRAVQGLALQVCAERARSSKDLALQVRERGVLGWHSARVDLSHVCGLESVDLLLDQQRFCGLFAHDCNWRFECTTAATAVKGGKAASVAVNG